MKTTLINIIRTDNSCNKSLTRYLYKTHPDLWNQIVEATSFLPIDALAKQRCWHILNDVYTRPVCPVSGEFVKWKEKKYETFSSIENSHKGIGQILSAVTKGDNHWRKKDPDKAANANTKFSTNLAEGNHKPWVARNRDQKLYAQKTKQTCLTKYGVSNPTYIPYVKQIQYQKAIERGCTPREQRTLRRLYYDAVWQFTEQSWKTNFDNINPNRINRSKNALDHIYSIQQGFRDSIPPYIIGHWTNLRVIGLIENSSKGMRCDKTQDQLCEDFFKNIGKY